MGYSTMRVLIALSCLVACVLAATTTHKPHTRATHEPSEHESVSFHYSPKTHNMIIKQTKGNTLNCYVATLTMQQQHDVHTDAGIRSLELKLLSQTGSATAVQSTSLDDGDVHACGHAPHMGTVTYYSM